MKRTAIALAVALLAPVTVARAEGWVDLLDEAARALQQGGVPGLLEHGLRELDALEARAREALRRARPAEPCRARGERLAAELPRAIRLAERSGAIFRHDFGERLARRGLAEGEFRSAAGEALIALQAQRGEFYAEVYPESGDAPVAVVFRGTRADSASDIVTDLGHAFGLAMPYYAWADAVLAEVARRFPGRRVIAAGHSLGGGLAMYAAARNGLEARVFNPAGLSDGVVGRELDPVRLSRAAAGIRAYVAREGERFDPVATLSLAGRSHILGQIVLVPVAGGSEVWVDHRPEPLLAGLHALQRRAERQGPTAVCDAALGPLPGAAGATGSPAGDFI